ncbi:MAG: enolase C-terminal domain-like protein [Balneolaceae bacterium]|nr:enolase C-terminal domain-like protein [Balneolaceae bacterium]
MLQLFEYELPFRSAFKTGSSDFKNRKGVLIHYHENNIDFVSEASPLPGFSRETFGDVRQSLLDQKRWIVDFLRGNFTMQNIRDLNEVSELNLPSILCGLSYLSLSILAKRQGKTIYHLFDKKPPQEILINDVIGHASIREMKNQIQSSIKKGFKVLKIKAPHPLDELASLLGSIQKDHPDIYFRLDANQSWPPSELKEIFGQLEQLPIEYIEEPCKINELSEIEEVQQMSPFPIALDESIFTINRLKTALALYPNLVLIVKPMVLGNILEIHETISQFRSSFKRIVVTTTLESRIGRTMTASTASLIGDPQMRHGLHTGHLLADDLLPDFKIENGSIQNLPKNPAIDIFSQIKTSYLKKLG